MRSGRNWALLVMLMFFVLGTLGISRLTHPRVLETNYREQIPLVIDGWRGFRMPVEPKIKRALKTEDIFFGRYSHPDHSQPIDLVVVSIPRALVHPPEMCFRGSGWEQTNSRLQHIQVSGFAGPIPMQQMLLQQADEKLVVLYTYRVKKRFLTTYWWYQVLQTLSPDGGQNMLIRVSTPPGGDEVAARELLKGFARQAISYM